MSFLVVETFYAFVDGDGEDLCFPGDIASDHQHHAEFADGVRECEDGGGKKSGFSQWQRDKARRRV